MEYKTKRERYGTRVYCGTENISTNEHRAKIGEIIKISENSREEEKYRKTSLQKRVWKIKETAEEKR